MVDASHDAPPAAPPSLASAIPQRRLAGWAWGLAGLVVVASALFSFGAPCGIWTNRALGQPFWLENDPGGWYLESAHELAPGVAPLFPGHPGTPLQLALWGVQHLGHALFAAPGSDPATWVAQHLAAVGTACKVVVALCHLATWLLLALVAQRLLRDRTAALVAALLYASSFPVLFYLSRLSVEPFAIGCLLATLLAAWRARDGLVAGQRSLALGHAAVAGVASVLGLFSKFVLCLPLPLVGLACALLPPRQPQPISNRLRVELAAVFVASALASSLLLSQWVDWGQFFGLWREVIENEATRAPALAAASGLTTEGQPLLGALRRIAGFPIRSYLPGATDAAWNSVFLACEWLLLIAATVGAVRLVRCDRAARRELLWPGLLVAWSIPFWLVNWAFHYLFVLVCIGAVTAASLLTLPRPQRLAGWSGNRLLAALGGALLLVHGLAIYAAIDSRLDDVRAFSAAYRPYHRALALADPAAPVAVIYRGDPPQLPLLSGLSPLSMYSRQPSRLAAAFASWFWLVDASTSTPEELERELRARGVRVVVDATPGHPPQLVSLVGGAAR